ncbi:hypothetical protein ANCCAN_30452 [Ancylostoma caninum]|uniref:7TM GPCR serpentine receptor class x (Srx) domain-containing protein n=1 Tax=Ancylostoma caninum TaxID=29170 RepID=A0A368EYJ8_ANCCA|nr:hypothetical protein ANCCAN_30452 [Ancylostoma caninum]
MLRCSVYFFDGCGLVFNTYSFTWNQSNTPCGHLVAFYLEYIMGTAVCVIVIIVNAATFILIYKHTKKLSAMSGTFAKVEANLHRNNLNFFLQVSYSVLLIALKSECKIALVAEVTAYTKIKQWQKNKYFVM